MSTGRERAERSIDTMWEPNKADASTDGRSDDG